MSSDLTLFVNSDVVNQMVNAMKAAGVTVDPNDYLLSMSAKLLGYAQSFTFPDQDWQTNTPIFSPNDLQPILLKSLLRIEIAVTFSGTAPKLHKLTRRGAAQKNDEVLSGVALTTGVLASFDTIVSRDETINFQVDQFCHIDTLKIQEIPVNS